MKSPLRLFLLLAVGTTAPAAEVATEAVAALGMLPNQRTGVRISSDERNPFAVKPKEVAKSAVAEDTETQESKIRSVFRQLKVTGVRRDRTGRSLALVGDLILRQGEEVEPVLEDQTEVLLVSKIEPKQIELTFVENKDSTQPRVIILPVKNQVQVAQKLFGQPKGRAAFYIAHGRATSELEEAAAAIAAAPPTAPATATPVATATGLPPAPITPRDTRREAAALAGIAPAAAPAVPAAPATAPLDPALAALMAGEGGSGATPPAPAPQPAPQQTAPQQTAAPSNAEAPAASPPAPPPTFNRRRTSPPPGAEQPPPPPGTNLIE